MDFIPNPLMIPVGVIIGFLVSAPIGPVNLLCIQRTIERGFLGSVPAIVGAVLGDGLIALFAALGVGAISGAVEHHRFTIQSVGAFALVYFGLKLFFSTPKMLADAQLQNINTSIQDYVWDIPQTFFLTMCNPGAVLGLFAIFGGISTFAEVHTRIDALTIVASIMGGSLSWWFLLSHIISRVRYLVDSQNLKKINRVAGSLLIGFGFILFIEILIKMQTNFL